MESSVRSIFDLCEPRADVLKGVTDADFAADLAKVTRGIAPDEYVKADKFFANTYPTRGLQNLLSNVCARLSGTGAEWIGDAAEIRTKRASRPFGSSKRRCSSPLSSYFWLVGTRRFNSSNQLNTTLICVAASPVSLDLSIKKCWPSRETS